MVSTEQVAASRLSRAQGWMLAVSCLAVALVVAAMAALYSALPQIAAETGATQQQLTWVVDGYTLALACLVLPGGALGDRLGRRLVLIVGLSIFTAGSLVPLIVDGPLWLIGARAVSGVGAALVMPSTLSLLTASFPEHRRGQAVGVWAGVAGSGGALGILGSGLLLQWYSWQTVFIGMSVAGALLLAAGCTVSESVDGERPAFDVLGAVTGAAAVGLIVVAAMEAPTRGWLSPWTIGALAGGVAAAAAFTVVELRAAHPLLDVRLLLDRGFGSGTLSLMVQFLVTFGVFMLLVQYLQLIVGLGPLASSLAIGPMVLPLVVVSLFSPWLATRFGLRVVTFGGLVIVGAGLLLVARLEVSSGYWNLLWALLIMSTGMGLCSAPATAAIVAGTPVEKHGVAAAVNDAAREVGAALGIAIGGSVLAAGYADRIAPALPHLPEAARGPVSDSAAAALQVAERAGPQGQPLVDFAEAAFMHGFHQSSVALGSAALAGAVLIAAWAPGRSAGGVAPDVGRDDGE
ncbi:MFS transporter [Nocardia sp. 2]|uniref:MFS transporter n=1 Tax=Nocardia acididurans TaxID=2802282 RepID=A0ABS1MCE6_9NOCA|nr:MFS transporter [Nocardia acididurans]MBL1078236.1 MFS transporter [Nocardia acididurans]